MTAFFLAAAAVTLLVAAAKALARMQTIIADMAQRIMEQEVAQWDTN